MEMNCVFGLIPFLERINSYQMAACFVHQAYLGSEMLSGSVFTLIEILIPILSKLKFHLYIYSTIDT